MHKRLFLLLVLFMFVKTQAQNVGIGTILPLLKLHIKGGLLLDSTNGTTPLSGAGTRMMWIPAKAAFRAGNVLGSEWDDINIGNNSFAGGTSTTASADFSTALGNTTKASGWASTTLGQSTIASGYVSTAMGNLTQATGGASTAMGAVTSASGNGSTATGYYTKSKSFGGFVTGLFNDSANAASPTNVNSLNRIFQIGNGISSNALSNAMTVLQNGNVGINTTTPQSTLQVNNGAVLFDGTTGTIPLSGAGTRMMWIPAKAAFRAGNVLGSEWDDINIGNNSFAGGTSTTASADFSTALGNTTKASGWASTTLGQSTIASGYVSTAMGNLTQATGGASTAMGAVTSASGNGSTATGYYTKSKSFGGFVTGLFNDSANAASPTNVNSLNRIFQIGNGISSNALSNAMTVLQNGNVGIGELNPAVPLNFAATLGNKIALWGNGTDHFGFGIQPSLMQVYTNSYFSDIAFGFGSSTAFTENVRFKGNGNVGIGILNPASMLTVKNDINVDNGDGNAGTTTNTLKFGGNGSGEAIGSNRTTATNQYGLDFYTFGANRMCITLGGNVGIGTTGPTATLSVNGNANNATGNWGVFSDARVKTLTRNFTDGLNVIRQINPVIFNYNDNAPFKTSDEQIGIVAQDLEMIAPYMVSKQAYNQFTDLREVNNQAYVFLLINAVKEQQQRIDTLEKLVKELSEKIK